MTSIEQAADVAIIADRLFDPASGTHLTDQAVLVRDGLIASIGPRGALPSACSVLDLGDSTVLPGLIDAHVHLAWDPWVDDREEVLGRDQVTTRAVAHFAKHLQRGITSVRDLGAPSGGVLAAAQSFSATGHDGIHAAGRAIGAPGGHAASISRAAQGAPEMRRAVEEQIEAGARCIKVMATGGVLGADESPSAIEVTADELAAIVETAHAHGIPVAVHAHALPAIVAAVEAGADSVEHASDLDEPTARAMADAGVRMVPTLSPLQVAARGDADLGLPAYLVGKAGIALQSIRRAAVLAMECGVEIVPGTDAGVPAQDHGWLLHELQELEALGMSRAACLRAATSAAAALLRAHDRGTLRVGSRADLIVVDGDPVGDSLTSLEELRLVVSGGRIVPHVRPSNVLRRAQGVLA